MRTARKLTAVAASAALIGAGSLLAAAPAQADINNRCSGGAQTESVTVASGGRLEIMANPSAGCTKVVIPTAMVASSADITANGSGVSGPTTVGANFEYTATSSINYVELSAVLVGGTIVISDGGSNSTTYTVTIGSSPGPNPNPPRSTSAGGGPAAWMQQFGKPASGTCEEAAPADLNLAGVGSGGWGESWAQWMNGGTGGAVCTRTLSYVGSGWTVS